MMGRRKQTIESLQLQVDDLQRQLQDKAADSQVLAALKKEVDAQAAAYAQLKADVEAIKTPKL